MIDNNSDLTGQTAIIDHLESLAKNPVNINSANAEDFLKIPGITIIQARKIIQFREINGRFHNISGLMEAAEISVEWFILIEKYITISEKLIYPEIIIRQRNQRNIERSRGYNNGNYSGSPLRSYSRIKILIPKTFSAGFLVEKDPGESSFIDHTVGYVDLFSEDRKFYLLLGNYSLDFAQGLTASKQNYLKKSRETVRTIFRNEHGVYPYLSSNEFGEFTGLYGNIKLENVSLSLFASKSRRDASINHYGQISNILDSGYHRTENEIDNKNNLEENVSGLRIKYSTNRDFILGVTCLSMKYDPSIYADNEKTGLNEFSGNNLKLIGTDLVCSFNNSQLFCEFAGSIPGSFGLVTGIVWELTKLRSGLIYRNYGSDFYSPYGSSFSDNTSEIRNERGLYFGGRYNISKSIKVDFYLDVFEKPLRTSSVPVKQSLYDYLFHLSWSRGKNSCSVDWNRKNKFGKSSYLIQNKIIQTNYEERFYNRLRFEFQRQLDTGLLFYSRFELRSQQYNSEIKGFSINLFKDPGYVFTSRIKLDYSS
ncbi:ComEA family DNA-binding protein, partial [candidate division KSB1 bacterium]